jgi:predicted methyltransferase
VAPQKSLLILLASLFLCSAAAIASEPETDRVDRGTSDPYTGDLSIFEEKDRDKKLQINRVMDLLEIKPGSNVADIGAGSGWFTVRSARRVGKEGLVYAVEINRKYLRHIERRARKEKLANIRTILGKADDPLLPPNSIDAVLLLKTYHEIEEPIRLMRRLRDALRPGALVGVIDRGGIGTDHGVNADVVIQEAQQAGYELVAHYDFVKSDNVDYFLVFR